MLRKILSALFCVSLLLSVPGCKEKTTEDKLKEAAESAAKDAEKATNDAKKKLGELGE